MGIRGFLDSLLKKTKLNIFIPIGYALTVYAAFLIFGKVENWLSALITAPIIMAIWFFFLFLVLYIKGRDFEFEEKYMTLIEFLSLLISALLTLTLTVFFFITFNYEITLGVAWGAVTWSAIAFYHTKRV